jgi:hypothetical protein
MPALSSFDVQLASRSANDDARGKPETADYSRA